MKRPRTPWPMGSNNFGPSIDISCLPGGYLGQGGESPIVDTDNFLLENGDAFLLENGDLLLLETE